MLAAAGDLRAAGPAGPRRGRRRQFDELDGTPAYHFHTKQFGYKWCDTVSQAGCHVGAIEIVFQIDTHGRRSEYLRQQGDRTLPAC